MFRSIDSPPRGMLVRIAARHAGSIAAGIACSLLVAASLLARSAAGADWPQFRGPDGQGHADTSDLPTTWGESENVRWKDPIPGLGWSSPVVSGKQIWLTTAVEEDGTLHAVCLDRESGLIVHDVEVFRKRHLGRIASKNSHASPTPVIAGARLVHYGAHGTACLSTAGQIEWTQELAYDHRHGPGGSPVVWKDLLIVSCDGPTCNTPSR